MPGLPVPSGGGKKLTELFGRKVTNVKKQSNAVQRIDPNQVEVLGAQNLDWSKVSRYILEHGRLPPDINPEDLAQQGGAGPSFHRHGDTHIHLTVQAAPTMPAASVEPSSPSQKSTERLALEYSGRAMMWMLKKMWESMQNERRASERAKERGHEIHKARLKLRQQRERNNRLNGAINQLVGHFFGFAVVMLLVLVVIVLAAVPRWNYYPGWWDYPPPPPHWRQNY